MNFPDINFSNDGVRGVAGDFPLTEDGCQKIGYAVAEYLLQTISQPCVLVGKDTRPSSTQLLQSIAYGLSSLDVSVWDLGVVTTPCLAYLVRNSEIHFGIMVTASHNPMEYNGLKFINHNGTRLDKDQWQYINKRIHSVLEKEISLSKPNRIFSQQKLIRHYVTNQIKQSGVQLERKPKIIVDCSNGSTSDIAPSLLRNIGANVIAINTHTSKKHIINKNCGSEYVRYQPNEFIKLVQENQADYGLAFDGDGDRLVVVDQKNNFYNGDDLLFLLSKYFYKQKILKSNTVVSNYLVNSGCVSALGKLGVSVELTKSGDRNIEKKLIDKNYILGAEPFGNIFIHDQWHIAADPLYAFLYLLQMIDESFCLNDLIQDFQKYPQILASFVFHNRRKQNFENFQNLISNDYQSHENGRTMIWASTTQPGLINIMVEGNKDDSFDKTKEEALNIFSLLCKKYKLDGTQLNLTNLSLRSLQDKA
jgi:phosphoglucosamine mutase